MRQSLAFSVLAFSISILLGLGDSQFGSGAAFAGGLVWLGLWLYEF